MTVLSLLMYCSLTSDLFNHTLILKLYFLSVTFPPPTSLEVSLRNLSKKFNKANILKHLYYEENTEQTTWKYTATLGL